MLLLHVKAPFAAFRPLVAGSFRQTAPFVTPTAAYGLLLNIAGIESRRFDPKLVATDTALGLPKCELAIGMVREPQKGHVLQQLHNYPVGSAGKERAGNTHGAKYNVQPITRELLVDIEAVIGLRGNPELVASVKSGLALGLATSQSTGATRYGVPFLGDNAFLIDVIEEISPGKESALAPRWYCALDRLPPHDGPRPGTCRMPLWIDRNNMNLSRSALFAPTKMSDAPPEEAWVAIMPSGLGS